MIVLYSRDNNDNNNIKNCFGADYVHMFSQNKMPVRVRLFIKPDANSWYYIFYVHTHTYTWARTFFAQFRFSVSVFIHCQTMLVYLKQRPLFVGCNRLRCLSTKAAAELKVNAISISFFHKIENSYVFVRIFPSAGQSWVELCAAISQNTWTKFADSRAKFSTKRQVSSNPFVLTKRILTRIFRVP